MTGDMASGIEIEHKLGNVSTDSWRADDIIQNQH